MPSGAALTRRGWTLAGAASGLLVAGRLLGARRAHDPRRRHGQPARSGVALGAEPEAASCGCERTVRPTRVHVGGDARVDLEVDDPGSADSPQLLLTDVFDGGRRAARFLVPALRRGQTRPRRVPGADEPARPLHARPDHADRHRPVRARAPQLDRRRRRRGHHLPARPRAAAAAGRAGPAAQRVAVRGAVPRAGGRRRGVPDPARVRGRRRPPPHPLALDRADRRARRARGRSAVAAARRRAARHAAGRARRGVVRGRGRGRRVRRRPARAQRAAGRGHHHRRPHARRDRRRPPPRHRRRGADHGRARGRGARRARQPRRRRPTAAGRATPRAARRGDGRAHRAGSSTRSPRSARRAHRSCSSPPGPTRRRRRDRSAGVDRRRRHGGTRSPARGTRRWSRGPGPRAGRRADDASDRSGALRGSRARRADDRRRARARPRVRRRFVRAADHRRRAPPPRRSARVARARRWPGAVLDARHDRGRPRCTSRSVIAPGSTTYGIPGPGTLDVLARPARPTAGRCSAPVGRRSRSPTACSCSAWCSPRSSPRPPTRSRSGPRRRSPRSCRRCCSSCSRRRSARPSSAPRRRSATAIVALVFLMLQHQALLEGHRSWASGRRIGSQATLVNAAAFVGGIALLAGLVVAPALPGVDDGPLIDYRSLGGSSAGRAEQLPHAQPARGPARPGSPTSPTSSSSRSRRRPASTGASPRSTSFDGEVWGIESQARDVGEALGRGRPPGTVRQQFTITALDDQWLPAAYEPDAPPTSRTRGSCPSPGRCVAPDREITGLSYRVDSRVATPTDAPRRSPRRRARSRRSLVVARAPRRLPRPSVRRRARAIVAGRDDPVRAGASALEAFFLDGSFTYDLRRTGRAAAPTRSPNFLRLAPRVLRAVRRRVRGDGAVDRAAGARRGRLRARRLRHDARRVPRARPRRARLARGVARRARAGRSSSRRRPATRRARPTRPSGHPPAPAPTSADHADDRADHRRTTGPDATPSPFPRGESEVQAGSPTGDRQRRARTAAGWSSASSPCSRSSSRSAGSIMRVARKVRRRTRRRRRDASPRTRSPGAWQDALERLTDAGLPPSETLTPHEQAERLRRRAARRSTRPSRSQDLADLYARAGWSLREPTEDDVAPRVVATPTPCATRWPKGRAAASGSRARR